MLEWFKFLRNAGNRNLVRQKYGLRLRHVLPLLVVIRAIRLVFLQHQRDVLVGSITLHLNEAHGALCMKAWHALPKRLWLQTQLWLDERANDEATIP